MRTYWQDEVQPHETPLPARTGTVVVGAGVGGLSAAIALHGAGEECVVVESGGVGGGASSRNAGFLMRGAADNYAAGVRQYGRELAQSLWRATEENLASLLDLGVEEVRSFERRASTLLAYDEDEAADVRESAHLMKQDGFDVALLESGHDAVWRNVPARVALSNPLDAVVNPFELIAWLWSKVEAPIVEHAPVFAIEPGEGVVVRTTAGDVRAERVLVCTNAWTQRLAPSIPIEPNRGQMLALRVPSEVRLDDAYYANRGSEYFRRVSDDAVIVGGWRRHFERDEQTDTLGVTADVQAGLEGFAGGILGDRFPVTHRWGGIMGFTPDALPRVGPIDGDDRVWVCAGFTGHGMSLAHLTATRGALALLAGGDTPAWTRRPEAGAAG